MFRKERAPPSLRSHVVAAWAITLLLHGGLVVWLLRPVMATMKPVSDRIVGVSHRLQLRLFPSRRPKLSRRVSTSTATAVTKNENTARRSVLPASRPSTTASQSTQSVSAGGAPSLSLFNPDGSICMAGETAKLRDSHAVDMRHFQQLPCHGTRFSERWTRGQNESLGNEIARKYLSVVGLYNPATEAAYQKRRAYLDEACPH